MADEHKILIAELVKLFETAAAPMPVLMKRDKRFTRMI